MTTPTAEITFGRWVRERRLALGMTLRQFCEENDYDPGNHSKLERGIFPPPEGYRLATLAAALRIEAGSDDWNEMFRLAEISDPVYLRGYAAGRAEGLKEAAALCFDNGEYGLQDAIDALTATHGTKNEKTPPRAE